MAFNPAILAPDVQAYLRENRHADVSEILFKKRVFKEVANSELAQQLQSRIKCEKKLPTWYAAEGIYYPSTVSIEQASSEVTAAYKAQFINGGSVIDATGGMGVDSLAFAQRAAQVTHCENDPERSQVAAHNLKILGGDAITAINADALDHISGLHERAALIYLDPSRRPADKKRAVLLEDCLPNVPQNLELLLAKADAFLVKAAPMLDIEAGLNALKTVSEVHVVAYKGEVKEVLFLMDAQGVPHPPITSVNLGTPQVPFRFTKDEEERATNTYAPPQAYLYQPHAASLKAGAFKCIGQHYGLNKLHRHTHLYTSDTLVDFPGKRFIIQETLPYNGKNLKKCAKEVTRANITTRNFPLSVSDIRKKAKIAEGGEHHLFFTTLADGQKAILVCERV